MQCFHTKLFSQKVCFSTFIIVVVLALHRSSGKDLTELHEYIMSLVERINKTYGDGDYKPVVWLGRPVPILSIVPNLAQSLSLAESASITMAGAVFVMLAF